MTDRVVVIDDSLTVRMDLADAFAAAGFEVLPCASALEARRTLASHRADVIILDMILPDGDGAELLKEIRASTNNSDAVVLILSSEAEVKDRIRGLNTGAHEYIGKPYDSVYVVARARELLSPHKTTTGDVSTVLVIDDSATFREALVGALSDAGYIAIGADTGETGLRAAAAHLPDAIIVDGQLPGIDGAGVIRMVRFDAALRSIPCLLLTGAEDRGAELAAFDAGADAFARKDETLDLILAKLTAMIRNSHADRSHGPASLLAPKKILAVDDSVTYLETLGDALRGEGYDVQLARSGEQALELLAVQLVDCVLLDVTMPGIGGEETCRRIKAAPMARDVPIIMLTSLESHEDMIRGLGAGADDYIPKSSALVVVRARVRAQLRRKQFEDENRRVRVELLQRELEASEARAAKELADIRSALVEELERKNEELEAFSYTVSHDLKAPLRAIEGFSTILADDHAHQLDSTGRGHLDRVRSAAKRMAELIDDLIQLSRVGQAELRRVDVDLSSISRSVIADLEERDPNRRVTSQIEAKLTADADQQLIKVALENLIGNAWKFTARVADARIEIGTREEEGIRMYFIRDNGAGFNMKHSERLFRPFQRLHTSTAFPGTGIGLATVRRIIDRHSGRIWAEGAVDEGATFFFTLGERR